MKHKISKLILLFLITPLWGCVEFRDQDESENVPAEVPVQAQSQRQHSGDLVVNQDLYIYEGKILTTREFHRLLNGEIHKEDLGTFDFNFLTVTFERGTLYTLGNTVRIFAKEIHGAGGKIATFPENQTALQGKDGADGGHILLQAEYADGHLTIEMRGENGGEGFPGNSPTEELKGKKGNRGQMREGVAAATRGGAGQSGKQGFPGKPGGRGGNSGTLELNFQNGEQFTPDVVRIAGKGGQGGVGGAGGEGGDGGAPGTGYTGVDGYGPKGKQGPQGPSGENGYEGVVQTVCITGKGNALCF